MFRRANQQMFRQPNQQMFRQAKMFRQANICFKPLLTVPGNSCLRNHGHLRLPSHCAQRNTAALVKVGLLALYGIDYSAFRRRRVTSQYTP